MQCTLSCMKPSRFGKPGRALLPFCTHSALDQHQQVSCSEKKPQPRSTKPLQLCPQPFSQRRASLSMAGAGETQPASDMQMWASRKRHLGVSLLHTGGSG